MEKLRPTDLRIGNFVHDQIIDDVLRVTGIAEVSSEDGLITYTRVITSDPNFSDEHALEEFENSLSGITPILITPEWLSPEFNAAGESCHPNFGFEKHEDKSMPSNNPYVEYRLGNFTLIPCEAGGGNIEFAPKDRTFLDRRPIVWLDNMTYVHELQNLYFSLMGEELILSNK